jgi:hypothetical protein
LLQRHDRRAHGLASSDCRRAHKSSHGNAHVQRSTSGGATARKPIYQHSSNSVLVDQRGEFPVDARSLHGCAKRGRDLDSRARNRLGCCSSDLVCSRTRWRAEHARTLSLKLGIVAAPRRRETRVGRARVVPRPAVSAILGVRACVVWMPAWLMIKGAACFDRSVVTMRARSR